MSLSQAPSRLQREGGQPDAAPDAVLCTDGSAMLASAAKDLGLEHHALNTLRGERKFEKDVKKENYHRIERAYGSFSRAFTLGSGVSPDKVKAEFEDGEVLLLNTETT